MRVWSGQTLRRQGSGPPGSILRFGVFRSRRAARAEWCGQDDDLQHDGGQRAAHVTDTSRLGDEDITEMPMYRRARMGITYLPQEASIFRKLTVADNIGAILETVESNRVVRSVKQRLVRAARRTRIDRSKANRKGADLSGGERRRVEITRALVSRIPNSCLLDEPFAGVDPIAVIDIQKIIEQLRESRHRGDHHGSQRSRETLSICDRAYIIKDGAILRHGDTRRDCGGSRGSREVYLGKNFSLNWDEAVSLDSQCGHAIGILGAPGVEVIMLGMRDWGRAFPGRRVLRTFYGLKEIRVARTRSSTSRFANWSPKLGVLAPHRTRRNSWLSS